MKYEFKKNGEDDYSLIYKDKEIKFKSNVNAITRLQECEAVAKIKMIDDLASKGKSLRDYTIEIKKDGKTYYDNTNKVELTKLYVQKEFVEVYSNLVKEILGKEIQELYNEMELNETELQKFSEEFGMIITGQYKFPSREILQTQTTEE